MDICVCRTIMCKRCTPLDDLACPEHWGLATSALGCAKCATSAELAQFAEAQRKSAHPWQPLIDYYKKEAESLSTK